MHNNLSHITIAPFQPENQVEVKNLILAGLEEYWGTLDLSKNPDLNDIQAAYANGVFLVAWRQGKIVGTGAFKPKSDGVVEVVRMSVAADVRRLGIGRIILEHLCEQAKLRGYQQIILETTETWLGAIEFYQQFGFRITHYQAGDVYFAYDLGS
jgi:ribosomal protein S18 acetylase RimI-like enzyme